MLNISKYKELLKREFMTERQKLTSCLTTKKLKLFAHPTITPQPTVDAETRCKLENIGDTELSCFYVSLSDKARNITIDFLKSVISTNVYNEVYPMSTLHGFTTSKSEMSRNRQRVLQPTMADMGALVDDLPKLKGLEGDAIINECKSHGELRLYNGIKLYTDNWHQRFYWDNKGGSHHMAVLCYELQKQKKEWFAEVEIEESIINIDSLENHADAVSLFVIMSNLDNKNYIFNNLPRYMDYANFQEKLGTTVTHFGPRWAVSNYQLVILDHSKEYADLSHNHLLEMVNSGYAMRLYDFLGAWVGINSPSQQL